MRFVVFDSWRGICALLVVLFHFDGYTHFYDLNFVRHAWLFVDFFFVLSGFVITYADEHRLLAPRDTASFMIRRFGRLWPLHAALLGVLVCDELVKYGLVAAGKLDANFAPFAGTTSPASLVSNLFLVQSLGFHSSLTWNVPSWSISVEFVTYVVYAAFCMLTVRSVAWARSAASAVIVVCAAMAVFALSPQFMKTEYDFGIFRCICGFFAGALTYDLYRRGVRLSGVWEIPAVIGVTAFVAGVGIQPWSVAAPVVFAFALLAFSSQSGPLSRLLQTRPFVALGTWSYSIYLVHWVLFVILAQLTTITEKLLHTSFHVLHQPAVADAPAARLVLIGSKGWMDLEALVCVVAAVLIASQTYRFIEAPARSYFSRLAKKAVVPEPPRALVPLRTSS